MTAPTSKPVLTPLFNIQKIPGAVLLSADRLSAHVQVACRPPGNVVVTVEQYSLLRGGWLRLHVSQVRHGRRKRLDWQLARCCTGRCM